MILLIGIHGTGQSHLMSQLDDDEDTSDDEEDTSDDEVDTSDDEDIINPRDLVNFSYEYDCFWEHRLPDGSLSYRTVDAIRYGEIVI